MRRVALAAAAAVLAIVTIVSIAMIDAGGLAQRVHASPQKTAPADDSDAGFIARSIERRPPARPLSRTEPVDVDSVSIEELDHYARESRERWLHARHGAMLLRILPERLQPSQLPQAGSRAARLVSLYCVQCHSLPDPAMHDAATWPQVVRRMVPRMQGRGNLGPLMADLMRAPDSAAPQLAAPDEAEEREIVAYLQQHAQRRLDPAADPALAAELKSGNGRIFVAACSQCHALPDPAQHTAGEWPAVVERMQRNMQWMNRVVSTRPDPRAPQLTVSSIIAFLQDHAGDADQARSAHSAADTDEPAR